LNAIVAGVERGEGSLGMLIKERKLHEELEATLDNLNTLIDDIKEHPQRYITIEIF
jgi:phospholipid/cholesterol/gamma-HCH transport system substrate-binding protein